MNMILSPGDDAPSSSSSKASEVLTARLFYYIQLETNSHHLLSVKVVEQTARLTSI